MTQWTLTRSLQFALLLVTVLILVSCASGYGPPVDQARLENAHKNAADSLELARKLNAPDYANKTYTRAQAQFEKTFDRLKQSPSPTLIDDYQEAVTLARESSLEAAREQIEELQDLRKEHEEVRASLKKKTNKLRRVRKESSSKSDTITRLKSRLTRLNSSLREQDDMRKQVRELKKKLARVRDRRSRKAVMVRFDTAPLFEAGSADFTPKSQRLVDSIVPFLKEHDDRMIQVRGYTDALPIAEDADFKSNWELSAHRAINVVKYLVYVRGIEKDRVMAIGMAGYHSRVPNRTERQRERNRRVEILLQPPDSQIAVEGQQILTTGSE